MCLMAEGIVLSPEHLLGVTCQVRTRCRSFSNDNGKDLRTAIMLSSILSLSTLPLRLPFALQLPFLYFSPAYDQSPSSKDIFAYGLLPSRSCLVCSFGDSLGCMIMDRDFYSSPSISVLHYLSTKLECIHSQPPDFNFRCQSRICSVR